MSLHWKWTLVASRLIICWSEFRIPMWLWGCKWTQKISWPCNRSPSVCFLCQSTITMVGSSLTHIFRGGNTRRILKSWIFPLTQFLIQGDSINVDCISFPIDVDHCTWPLLPLWAKDRVLSPLCSWKWLSHKMISQYCLIHSSGRVLLHFQWGHLSTQRLSGLPKIMR